MLWAIRTLIGWGAKPWLARAIAFGGSSLLIAGAITLTVRSCDRKDTLLVETATEKGRTDERAAVNQGVIKHAEKVAEADAALAGSTVAERMRTDPRCRDCASD